MNDTTNPLDCIPLFDRPEAIPVVARWYYDEWGRDLPDNSPEICAAWLAPQVNRVRAPLHLVAVSGPTVLGTAAIKPREMEIFPEREHWLGGVFVPPEFRAQGVAAALSSFAIAFAQSLGIPELYLQTDRLDGGLYARVGFRPLERVHTGDHEVLVMHKDLRG